MKAEAKKQAKIEARLARRPRPPTPPRKYLFIKCVISRTN